MEWKPISECETKELFTIRSLGPDSFFAVRRRNPRFVLHGRSISEVALMAEKALTPTPPETTDGR